MASDEITRLQAELQAARAESEAKSRLLSHTSHEIRTQLAGVMGLAQAAQETRLTPEQQELFDLIVTSGEAMLTLVNDLLDLSKMEAGMLGVERITFGLWDVLDDIVATFRSGFEEKHLTLELDRSADVPDRVSGDPGRIRQILANLLANARRFTDVGGARLEVRVAGVDGDATVVEFTVADSGTGIPADEQAAIFRPYEQSGDAIARLRGGTGLGLAISLQLAELMGGTLAVESVPGEGSRFGFRVPLYAPDRTLASDGSPSNVIEGLPMLVMSARPEPIRDAITVSGARIDVAACVDDMNEKLAAADEHPYAMVLVEGQDALHIAEDLRRRKALDTTHIVVLAPTGQRGDAARCRELRVAGYLTAPYASPDVAGAVSEVLAGPAPADLTVLVTRHWLRERRRRLSILVVDDSPTLRMTSMRLLERRGHSVRTVGGGDAAVKAVLAHRYDAIVMDINMPGVDGVEATKRIRASEFGSDVPIIAVSSLATDEARARVMEAGAEDLLSRPFEVYDLVAAIERGIAARSV